MKRLLAATTLMLFCIAMCFAEKAIITKSLEKTLNSVTTIKAELENGHEVNDLILDTAKDWKFQLGILSVFIDHDGLDEISRQLERLKATYAYNRDECIASASDLQFLIENIINTENINAEGLL